MFEYIDRVWEKSHTLFYFLEDDAYENLKDRIQPDFINGDIIPYFNTVGDLFIIYKNTISFPTKISIDMSTISLSLSNCIRNYTNIILEPREYSSESISYSMTQTIYNPSGISTKSYDQEQYGAVYYMTYSFNGYNIMKFVNQANQGIFLGWNRGGDFLNNGINCNVKFLYS